MAKSSNVVADVVTLCTKSVKTKDSTVQAPSKWAAAAGYQGSAASPLRQLIARVSGNGCGRTARYPAVDAAGMLELIQLGESFQAAEGVKAATISKRVRTKLYPASKSGAKAAKSTVQRKSRTKTAA